MKLQIRMWLLVALLFALLYGAITGIGTYLGMGSMLDYIILSFVFVGIQYLAGPWLVSMLMQVKYVSEAEEPELHHMVGELAARAGIPKPKVGISRISIPNAFAFGRSQSDGRICITEGIRGLLNKNELEAVVGHEMSHLKHRDMLVITLLSVIPLVFYWIAMSFMWGGSLGNRRSRSSLGVFVGIGALIVYYVSNLLVLYGSRIREYYADEGSVRLGNQPVNLASALYRLANASAYSKQTAKGKEEARDLQPVKAFFVSDISQSWTEVRELKELDTMKDGRIDFNAFLELKDKKVKLGTGEKMLELFMTHPNMLKRVKHLATLV